MSSKPKISTGFFTPPANRKRPQSQPSTSNDESFHFNDELYEKLMSDPIKRKLIMEIISQEKDAIEEYKRNEERKKQMGHRASPFNKLQKVMKCESPTALLRRRALEQQNRDDSSESSSSRPTSRQSTLSHASPSPSPIPFNRLLEGVTAYVEVKSKDQDRSAGAKALMKAMGAKIRDTFTKDVTHVIFKDGSFSTYQKAKLIKVKLVSVLWLEAVRNNNYRVPEKDYPALGSSAYDNNISTVCSQLQKEYAEVIREEVRRSLISGTPLPSTKIERRRTLTNPILSDSFSKSRLPQELSQTLDDQEVERINRRQTVGTRRPSDILEISPELTSDDDSEVGLINGRKCNDKRDSSDIIDESSDNLLTLFKRKKSVHNSDMDLTLLNTPGRSHLKEISSNTITDMELTSIRTFREVSRKELAGNDENSPNLYRRRTLLIDHTKVTTSSDTTNISDDKNSHSKTVSDSTMSELQIAPSSDIAILSKNCSSPAQKNNSTMSSLQLSSKNSSTRTNMSALKLSSDRVGFNSTTSNTMSSLKISNESLESRGSKRRSKDSSMAPLQLSSEKLEPKNVSVDKDGVLSSRSSSSNSSEIISTNRKSAVTSTLGGKDLLDCSNKISSVRQSKRESMFLNSINDSNASSKTNLSFSPVDVNDVIKILDDNITRRRKPTNKCDLFKEDDQAGSPKKRTKPLPRNESDSSPPRRMTRRLTKLPSEINVEVDKDRAGTSKRRTKSLQKTESDLTPSKTVSKRLTMLPSEINEKTKVNVEEGKDRAGTSKRRTKSAQKTESDLTPSKLVSKRLTKLPTGEIVKDNSDECVIEAGEINAQIKEKGDINIEEDKDRTGVSKRRTKSLPKTKSDLSPSERLSKLPTNKVVKDNSGESVKKKNETNVDDKDKASASGKRKSLSRMKTLNEEKDNIIGDKPTTTRRKSRLTKLPSEINSGMKNNDDDNSSGKGKKPLARSKSDIHLNLSYIETGDKSSTKQRKSRLTKLPSEINTQAEDKPVSSSKHPKTLRRSKSNISPHKKSSITTDDKKPINRRKSQSVKDALESSRSPDQTTTKRSTCDSSNSDDSSNNNPQRLRKLYNPDSLVIPEMSISDEKERKEKRLLVRKRKSDDVFIVPKVPQASTSTSESESSILQDFPIPKTKKTKKTALKKELPRFSQLDEQKELAAEFLSTPKQSSKELKSQSEKSALPKRKSTRVTQPPQNLYKYEQFLVPTTPSSNRRSTLEFQHLSQSAIKKLKIDRAKQPTIVCTKMHAPDVETFQEIVRKLGRFRTEDEVTKNTTHLVAGEPKRTINMLRAIALGCWILKKDWLYASLEAGKWLPEEDYEETSFSPAVQQSRLQRQAFGPKYTIDVFQNSGKIYIAKSSTPRCSDLRELVQMCQGRIVLNPDIADIIVGEYHTKNNIKCVNETWVLDSISFNKTQPLKKYLLNAKNKSLIV